MMNTRTIVVALCSMALVIGTGFSISGAATPTARPVPTTPSGKTMGDVEGTFRQVDDKVTKPTDQLKDVDDRIRKPNERVRAVEDKLDQVNMKNTQDGTGK
jgi:TolA-binding protein